MYLCLRFALMNIATSLVTFSVIDLPQEESFNYLTVLRIENQKNAKETVVEIGD